MTDAGQGGPGARKRGRPTESERAQRRDDILDAAVRLLIADGYPQVTLDDIRAEAHVTKRTIYAYFGDRAEIFLAAVERLRDRTLARPDEGDGLEQLASKIVFALQSDEAIGLHRLMIAEARTFPQLAAAFYHDGPESYVAALDLRLPESDPPRAEALFALLLGESHRRRLLGLAEAPTRTEAAALARVALDLLGARAAASSGAAPAPR